MAKTATNWYPAQPGTVATTNSGVLRVLEDGTARNQEDSTQRQLEVNVITPKSGTVWS